MDVQWTVEDIETNARTALGAELSVVAVLFPRVVNAIYSQMMNGDLLNSNQFSASEFRQVVLKELPTSCDEVLPFFVRTVWNKNWTPQTHELQIRELASQYVKVVELAGGSVSLSELMTACQSSFGNN
ncbi:hypothetical protein EBU99_09480 [bacterium]|nr:hypothetical protein [bacterium]